MGPALPTQPSPAFPAYYNGQKPPEPIPITKFPRYPKFSPPVAKLHWALCMPASARGPFQGFVIANQTAKIPELQDKKGLLPVALMAKKKHDT